VDASGQQTGVLAGAAFVTCQILLNRVESRWLMRELNATQPVV
jgi:hypothetical protein